MAVEGKRKSIERKTINQMLANTVKLGMNLSAGILRSGNQIHTMQLYGITINFLLEKSRLMKLDVNFEKNIRNLTVFDTELTLANTLNFVCHNL